MKKLYLFLFTFSSLWLHAQVTIKGTVFDQKGNPLQGASVYLNNTTIGTSSDADGYFSLSVDHGYYSLVASYVGFETTSYNVNTLDLPQEIVFVMFEKNNQLNEIVVSSEKKWASKRAYFLKQFTKFFLGESYLGKRAYIKNKHVLDFEYDEKNNLLEVFASEPLIIENKGLGYKITYDLIHFELQDFGVSYLGFVRYEHLQGNERKQKKWQKERALAYFGSLRHFLNAAIHKELKSGFVVDKVKLVPNPNLPTDEEIAAAKEIVRRYGGLQLNPYSTYNMNSGLKLKAANDVLKRSKGNQFIEVPIQINLPVDQFFTSEEEGHFLFLEDDEDGNMAYRVRYENAYQESNYQKLNDNATTTKQQVSRITLFDDKILINPKGIFHNPLDVFLEGYWGFKKVADQLPLDYKPDKPSQ
jgi:hypothetical protein